MKKNPLLSLVLTNALFVSLSSGSVLLEWSFASDAAETSNNVVQTTRDALMDDSFLNRGLGLNPDANNADANGPFTSKAQGSTTDAGYTTDIDTAMGNGQFVTFTVDSSTLFSIDSVAVNDFYGRSATGFKFQFFLFSSIDGFASGNQLASTASYGGDIFFDATVAANSAAYQNLAGPVEFRILTTGTEGASYIEHGFGTKGGDVDLVVMGTVPEPSTFAIFAGMLTLGFVLMRRRIRD